MMLIKLFLFFLLLLILPDMYKSGKTRRAA